MFKIFTSLLLATALLMPGMATAQVRTTQPFSLTSFQQRLNTIAKTRKGPAAANAIIALYARYARVNPLLAFTLVRMATIQVNRFTPPSQRAAAAVRLSDATAAAFAANSVSDTSLVISTFTYLVANVPPDSREAELIKDITNSAIIASGGTPEENSQIADAIKTGATTTVPTS